MLVFVELLEELEVSAAQLMGFFHGSQNFRMNGRRNRWNIHRKNGITIQGIHTIL